MSNKDRNTGGKKPRGAGRPFAKGPDPRRNVYGQRNKAAVRATKLIRDKLVQEGKKLVTFTVDTPAGKVKMKARNIDLLAKRIWREAVEGDPSFVQIVLDRTEGKVTQPIDNSVSGTVAFIMPRPGQKPEGNK
jgi:hypothetical protein